MKRKTILPVLMVVALILMTGTAMADTSVAWLAPPDGSSYDLGTLVDPQGQASATGIVGGAGLDLALVLDSSGSMAWAIPGFDHTGQWYQAQAAHALVNALPIGTTSVTVIEFDSYTSTVSTLLALSTNISDIHNAIDSVDASGGTYIGKGIVEATTELTSVRHTPGRQQMMVVISDGDTSGTPETDALNAIAAGIDAIHTVGIPGHTPAQMRDIADGPDDTVGTSDDYGVYTGVSDLNALIGIFDGTEGSLVGIDYVTVELPDSTILSSADGDFTVDGLGNFVLNDQIIALIGANEFIATAYGTDMTSASATLTLYGTDPVPEPATMLLLGSGLIGMAGLGRKKKLIK